MHATGAMLRVPGSTRLEHRGIPNLELYQEAGEGADGDKSAPKEAGIRREFKQ